MALSTPPHAAAPVLVAQPGTCGGCGLATAYACPQCCVAHFCTPGCLERALEWHARECGTASCKAVELPPWHQLDTRGCGLNALLRGGCGFSLSGGRSNRLQPSPTHGLTPLQLPAELAGLLAQLVARQRDEHDYLKIGDVSYPGYGSYKVIPAKLDAREQMRATSMLARKGPGGAGYDRQRGLQYALDNCACLALLVRNVCEHLGLAVGAKEAVPGLSRCAHRLPRPFSHLALFLPHRLWRGPPQAGPLHAAALAPVAVLVAPRPPGSSRCLALHHLHDHRGRLPERPRKWHADVGISGV